MLEAASEQTAYAKATLPRKPSAKNQMPSSSDASAFC